MALQVVVGIDQSYTCTGISLWIGGKLRAVHHTKFKGCKEKWEKRTKLRNLMQKLLCTELTEVKLKVYPDYTSFTRARTLPANSRARVSEQAYEHVPERVACKRVPERSTNRTNTIAIYNTNTNTNSSSSIANNIEYIQYCIANNIICITVIVERIRHFNTTSRAQYFNNKMQVGNQAMFGITYIKATAGLMASIVDGFKGIHPDIHVYSVDTRMWKARIVGKGHTHGKQDTMDFVRSKGIEVVNDDEADAVCIGRFGVKYGVSLLKEEG